MLKAFVAAAAISTVLGIGAQSHAFAVRRSAVECFASTSGEFSNISGGTIVNNSNGSLFVYCPSPEDSVIRAQNTTTINVHGRDASSTDFSSAQVCYNHWHDDGGACRNSRTFGSFSSPGAVGEFGLQLGSPNFASTWTSGEEGHFKYIQIRLGAKGVESWDPSTLRGIFFAGTP